jgi:hypothetical protein
MADVASPRSPDATDAAPRLLGLRQSALVEIAIFFAAALAIDFLFLDFGRYAHLEPHPFWLIVLLCAVQYGTGEALLAAAAATAALLVGNMPAQGFDEDLYAWLLRATLDPLMWAVAAVLFGELQGRVRRERDGVRAELEQSRRREEVIAAAYRRLDARRESLEARVAGQLRTVFAIYNAAKGIERMSARQVDAGVGELVRTVMGPRRYSLFLLRGGVLELAMSEGWPADAGENARSFDGGAPLFQAVVGSRRTLVAAVEADDRAMRGEGLLAAPLLNVDTGEVVGMLKIEEMGFLDLTATTIENFRLLCEWIGTAYANASRAARAKADS